MSRAEIERFVERMSSNMELHKRELKVDMPAGATVERIEQAEHDAGLMLPSELRYFLEQADGLECSSESPTQTTEFLAVPTLSQVFEYTANNNRAVLDISQGSGMPTYTYVVCGLYLDDTFVIRDGEHAVLLLDFWADHVNWLTVASSFDEWLTRSFESMATTANGFRFFEPIRTLW
jgi:hypothetical protein